MPSSNVDTPNTDILAAVMNAILPGGDGFPSARPQRFGSAMMADAAKDNDTEMVRDLLSKLPETFVALEPGDQVAALQTLEASETVAFSKMIRHAYHAYYTDSDVRSAIEEITGYPARPPHFEGYEMEPFDAKVVAVQRQREPFWRKV
ncbi:MAG: hypothetical protein HN793_04130 [Rhodospirillaceae bacterium]|jgi:hypothetical protein|nr:hypothetical protein [Rhodospirillaceae bacterium]MBT5241679.1 hypothetical protein [Rhodospirillaceae bacterium]MBT5566861.1 hypothetical protein [Rhodospirillaceae bacterium]MBT6090452.1 hypothetical protein [Rhodospirillaceae bacterium]MBT6961042.1 hypothetical protein [Rhodospirillaceae bacterium]